MVDASFRPLAAEDIEAVVEIVNVLAGAPALGFYLAHGWERDGRSGIYEAFGLPTLGLAKRLG